MLYFIFELNNSMKSLLTSIGRGAEMISSSTRSARPASVPILRLSSVFATRTLRRFSNHAPLPTPAPTHLSGCCGITLWSSRAVTRGLRYSPAVVACISVQPLARTPNLFCNNMTPKYKLHNTRPVLI